MLKDHRCCSSSNPQCHPDKSLWVSLNGERTCPHHCSERAFEQMTMLRSDLVSLAASAQPEVSAAARHAMARCDAAIGAIARAA